jgi:hypothetical protein
MTHGDGIVWIILFICAFSPPPLFKIEQGKKKEKLNIFFAQ